MDFFTLYHFLNHGELDIKIPTDIIREYIWPMLSFPHQGRCGYDTQYKNICLKDLPSLEMWYGPKIIYNLKRVKPLFHPTTNFNYPATVKFMYVLKYSKKHPNEYINILEYTTLLPSEFNYKNNCLDMKEFSTRLREIYHLPLLTN